MDAEQRHCIQVQHKTWNQPLSSYSYNSLSFIFNWTSLSMTKHMRHRTTTCLMSESESLIWAQRPVCLPRSKWVPLINQPRNQAYYLLLQCQSKCPIMTEVKKKNHCLYRHNISDRNSPIIHSPSHRWKRTSLSVQFSVCGLNLMQLAENGQMLPTRPRERNRGACSALPAPAADSRSPWLATR